MAPPKKSIAPPRSVQGSTPPDVVDPRWLLKMFALALAAALVCGYLTLGLLFYMGSWQLVLHPTRNAGGGTALPTERVHFGSEDSIAGEWLPAGAGARRGSDTVLYLRASDGQLDPADGTQLATLHSLGLNTLAFDYRGYGSSAERPHPSEANMLGDAETALLYLQQKHGISADHILVYGNGVGVSLAAQLLQGHRAGGLIGYNADPEVMQRVARDPRSKLFPMRLLFHNRFSLDALRTLPVPKLLYTVGPLNPGRIAVYKTAADPKLTVEVPTHNGQEERAALQRFLDTNFAEQPSQLTPAAR